MWAARRAQVRERILEFLSSPPLIVSGGPCRVPGVAGAQTRASRLLIAMWERAVACSNWFLVCWAPSRGEAPRIRTHAATDLRFERLTYVCGMQ